MGASRPLIILHPRYMDEIKSHPNLDFGGANRKVCCETDRPTYLQ
jgi:hypothetical protein